MEVCSLVTNRTTMLDDRHEHHAEHHQSDHTTDEKDQHVQVVDLPADVRHPDRHVEFVGPGAAARSHSQQKTRQDAYARCSVLHRRLIPVFDPPHPRRHPTRTGARGYTAMRPLRSMFQEFKASGRMRSFTLPSRPRGPHFPVGLRTCTRCVRLHKSTDYRATADYHSGE